MSTLPWVRNFAKPSQRAVLLPNRLPFDILDLLSLSWKCSCVAMTLSHSHTLNVMHDVAVLSTVASDARTNDWRRRMLS